MADNEKGNKKLEIGMAVEVNPQSDRSRKKIVEGVISKILTKSDTHPHGILVSLESGETGRVKRVLSKTLARSPKPASSHIQIKAKKDQLKGLIDGGESHQVEFKSDALWSASFTSEDIKNHRPQTKELHAYGQATSKIIIAKTLAGFLNSDGGTLIVGVKENKEAGVDEIVGIERELKVLKDPCQDGYRRMIVDLIKDYFPSGIFNHLNKYFHINFEKIEGFTVCGIAISKSDKRVFLKINNTDHFYIRTDASTRELTGEETVDYCQNRFD